MVVETPADGSDSAEPAERTSMDWSFARRPFWIFSHFFVAAMVVLMVNLGFWQLRRLDERQALNARVAEVIDQQAVALTTAGDIDDLDEYHRVTVSGSWLDGDFVRIINRSQDGLAGEYVVGLLEFDDGSVLVVNRGFVTLTDERPVPVPAGQVEFDGWVRPSIGRNPFGPQDTGDTNLMPSLDTEGVAERLGRDVPSQWVQAAPAPEQSVSPVPEPVPLPPVNDGPHLGYAVQWFTFSLLTVLFYGAMLRRRAGGGESETIPDVDGAGEPRRVGDG